MPSPLHHPGAAAFRRLIALATLAFLALAPAVQAAGDGQGAPIAGAFVYPVGNELDYTKPHEGESSGFRLSDPYLAVRQNRKHGRIHLGVDLTDGRGGAPVRAIASGEVIVADANGLIKVRTKHKVRVPAIVNGKKTTRTVTRWRTATKWRTGWGNYVVIRHTLPNGETVFSLYGHLGARSVRVKKGDVVAAGETIGLVGRSGRATSPHLHLEVRKSLPVETQSDGADVEGVDAENATVQDRTFAMLETTDPVIFLERHVRTFDDLDPASWESRYALAACRDGLLAGDEDRFQPDRAIDRATYYRALVVAFRLAAPGGDDTFQSSVKTLVGSGLLDPVGARGQAPGDRITRSEALEILLRCLDKKPAQSRNLGAIAVERVSSDFNRAFAGEDAAIAAEREARAAAAAQTLARKKAADAEYARALKAAKAKGAGGAVRKHVKKRVVKPVKPVIALDPGVEGIAQSKTNITRAETCLLLASALRLSTGRLSALERAAARVTTTASSG